MSGTVLAHAAVEQAPPVLRDALLLALVVTGVGYLAGARHLPGTTLSPIRRAAFVAGLASVAVVTTGPADAAADDRFAAHMAQHMALMLVAAPLMAVGGPGLPLLLALPRRVRRRLTSWRASVPGRKVRAALLAPAFAWAAHTIVLWGWHLPALFEAALHHPLLHGLEHASFVVAAVLFWTRLVTPWGARVEGGIGALYVFLTAMPAAALGAVLTLAPEPLYADQAGPGVSALRDQQQAGVVMWLPADAVYLAVIVVLVLVWLRRLDRSSPRTSHLPAPVPPALPGAVR